MAYHSLTIKLGGTLAKNTWDDWRLLPSSRPVVAPPEPVTNYVEVPGRNGALDYSDLLGSIVYKNRTGSWDFIVVNEERSGYRPADWASRYQTIANFLHGKYVTVSLEDDSTYEYRGRVWIASWNPGEHWSTITFNYIFDPFKYVPGATTGVL